MGTVVLGSKEERNFLARHHLINAVCDWIIITEIARRKALADAKIRAPLFRSSKLNRPTCLVVGVWPELEITPRPLN